MTSASAYPPGQHLTITAAAPLDPTHYVVVVTNGKPGCQLKLSVHGRDAYSKIGPGGTATVPLLVGPISGVYVIHARTYGCKATETATFISSSELVSNVYVTGSGVGSPLLSWVMKPLVGHICPPCPAGSRQAGQ